MRTGREVFYGSVRSLVGKIFLIRVFTKCFKIIFEPVAWQYGDPQSAVCACGQGWLGVKPWHDVAYDFVAVNGGRNSPLGFVYTAMQFAANSGV